MRFMMIMFPKSYLDAGSPARCPTSKTWRQWASPEDRRKAGVLVALDGLTPPATMSARVTFKAENQIDRRGIPKRRK